MRLANTNKQCCCFLLPLPLLPFPRDHAHQHGQRVWTAMTSVLLTCRVPARTCLKQFFVRVLLARCLRLQLPSCPCLRQFCCGPRRLSPQWTRFGSAPQLILPCASLAMPKSRHTPNSSFPHVAGSLCLGLSQGSPVHPVPHQQPGSHHCAREIPSCPLRHRWSALLSFGRREGVWTNPQGRSYSRCHM